MRDYTKLEKGMKSLKPKGDPYSDGVRAKIVGSSSDKRKRAQQISGLKKMKDKSKISARTLELISNPQASAVQIQELANSILEDTTLSATNRISLLKALNDTHKTIFGTKSLNVNVNVRPESAKSMEKIYQIVQEKKKKKQEEENDEKEK